MVRVRVRFNSACCGTALVGTPAELGVVRGRISVRVRVRVRIRGRISVSVRVRVRVNSA